MPTSETLARRQSCQCTACVAACEKIPGAFAPIEALRAKGHTTIEGEREHA